MLNFDRCTVKYCSSEYSKLLPPYSLRDYRRGPEAAGVHTTQDIAAGCSACLSTEGLRGSLRTGHHHTRQLVTADREFPARFKSAQVLPLLKKSGARQVIASQLQADI